ncbi:uncharacterized protein PRCAT00002512001 [Priceomyces carsonii]|uniref:uncharacterized protein n=1 Tax=Priceomyces carsonii TaxID=28549 RepID=UPI002EDA9614|nr:unnamed protein product [Priceomyces carsonii]
MFQSLMSKGHKRTERKVIFQRNSTSDNIIGTVNLDETVPKHPLYQAVLRCDDDELESYDYHKFYPKWGLMIVHYRIIVQKVCQVEKLPRVTFPVVAHSKYREYIEDIKRWKPELLKHLLNFILSLPMCEDGLEYISNMSASNSVASINIYTKKFPLFK